MITGGKFDVVITYYKNELDLKERQIQSLNKNIENIEKEKKELKQKIEMLKFENYKINQLHDTKVVLNLRKNKVDDVDKDELILQLQQENQKLKDVLNEYAKNINDGDNEQSFNCKKLSDDLYEMEIINRKNEEIIIRMTQFYNKLNRVFNAGDRKLKNIKLDFLSDDSLETFKNNLFLIENGVYSHLGEEISCSRNSGCSRSNYNSASRTSYLDSDDGLFFPKK